MCADKINLSLCAYSVHLIEVVRYIVKEETGLFEFHRIESRGLKFLYEGMGRFSEV